MLPGHAVPMAQPSPQSIPLPLLCRRANGRSRPVPFAAPAVDLKAEYQFWQIYDHVAGPLPGGGLRPAWLVLQKVYRDRVRFPADTHPEALSRVLFGANMTAGRAAELEALYGLVSRRLAAVALRDRAARNTA